MSLLERIHDPRDLRELPASALPQLADEIRAFLVEQVSRTGGHLGPNLGVVELTMALHRVFDSPHDAIVFDTGHQSYVHKLLTGRHDFSRLRQQGGLSGYPSRAESAHDIVESSHASSSLSWAYGIAQGRRVRGESGRHTVAVIGDGALTGGMAWEALNNIAAAKDLPLVVVINDNERSYAATIGGLADHLATLRTTKGYEQFLDWGKAQLRRTPVVGGPMERALHGVKKGIKDVVAPQGMFEDLGLKYIGPVDGHDPLALEHALSKARSFGGPVLVHAITQKGRGYDHAVNDIADQFHGIGAINPETGLPIQIAGRSWTDEFSDAMVEIGAQRPDVVAITAAMMMPVGLGPFADAYPDRIFDVGIAEQHAATMAAGLAFAGAHPVVAMYATFLNRAFDQLLMDCALHRAPVTFVLDRSGVTGPDGASHHGMWDLAVAAIVPGLHLAAPRDGQQVPMALRRAVEISDGPSLIRFPKGSVGEPLRALRTVDGVDVLAEPDDADVDVLLVGIGAMVGPALAVARRLSDAGHRVRVIDPVWALPVPDAVVELARGAGRVAVLEDGEVGAGVGPKIAYAVQAARVQAADGTPVPVDLFGLPCEFLDHGSRDEVLTQAGLTADTITTDLQAVLPPRERSSLA